MKRFSLFLMLVFAASCVWADGSAKLTMELRFPKTDFIMGESAEGTLILENAGNMTISHAFSLSPYSSAARLLVRGPVNRQCMAEKRLVEIGGHISGYLRLGPGEKAAPWPVRLKDWGAVAIGDYEIWAEYDSQVHEEGVEASELTPIKAESNHVRIRILAPSGEDARAFGNHHNACDQLTLTPEELLKDFSSSTYAGYVLAQRSAGVATQALTCLDDPDATLRHWGDRGGGETNTRAHIKEAQDAMRVYSKAAESFLNAHSDFVWAPLIRRKYAMCLGLTGCMPEALDQVRILAQGQGKEAEEAKAYLAAKGVK